MSFRKALKHKNNSETLDEKIAEANKEYQKTGIVIKEEPTNSTAGFYFASSENPEVPAVMADVPDPNGVLDDGFTPPIGGNGNANDPSNFPDAYDTAWMYNPNDVDGVSNRPVVKTMDQSVIDAYNTAFPDDDRFPSGGAGIVFGDIAFGTAVGYASDGHFIQVLNPGLFGNGSTKIVPPGSPFGAPWFGMFGMYFPATPQLAAVVMGMSGAYMSLGGYNPSGAKPIALWRPHSTFHDGQWDNWSGKKYVDSTSNRRYVLQNFYMHGVANDYVKTPKVPASTTILYRTSPSDPLFARIGRKIGETLQELFALGKDALDSLMPNIVQSFGMPIQIATSVGKNEPVNVPEPSNSEKQEFFDNLDPNLLFNPNDPANISPSGQPIQVAGYNGIPINDNKQPYSDDNFYIDPDTGKVTPHTTESKTKFPPNTGPQSIQSTIGGRGQAQSQVYQNENGEWVFSYEDHAYDNLNTTDPDETVGAATKASEVAHVNADERYGRNNGEVQYPGTSYETKKPDNTSPNTGGMSDYPCNSTACIRGDSILKFEIKVSDIENDDVRNRILSEIEKGKGKNQNENYIRKSIKESKISKVKLPGPNDELTVKAIDMIKLHKLNQYEIREYVQIVGKINQWIRENPKEYEIWKVRYPAKDPRLAELNWKLDSQLRASDEYMETNFPENEKLYKKIQNKIKDNIEKTDPRKIDTSVPLVSDEEARAARERRLNVLERYKKQVDVKPFFNKKTPEIDWKIDYLNKELAKNGIDEAMRTSTVYQGSRIVDNETYTDFTTAAIGGRGLGYSGMDGVAVGGAKIGDMIASEHGLDPVAHSSILGLKGVAQSPFNPNTGRRSFASTRTGMVSMSPAQPGKEQGTAGQITGSIIWYWNPTDNNPNGTQGAWRQLQFFPDGEGGGYWAVWGSNFLGFTVPRPDLNPSELNGVINNLQISSKGTIGTPQTTVLTQNRLDSPGFIPIDIRGLSTQGYNYLKGKASKLVRGIGSGLRKYGQNVIDAKPTLSPSQIKQRRGSAFNKMRGEGNPVGANQFYTDDRIKELNGKEKLTAREESELKDLQQYNEWISSFSDHQPVSDQQFEHDAAAEEQSNNIFNKMNSSSSTISTTLDEILDSPDSSGLSQTERKAISSFSKAIESGEEITPELFSNFESTPEVPTPPTPPKPSSSNTLSSQEFTFPDGSTGKVITTQSGDEIHVNSDGKVVNPSGNTAAEDSKIVSNQKLFNNIDIATSILTNGIVEHTPSEEAISQFKSNITPDIISKFQFNTERVGYSDGNFNVTYDENGKKIFNPNRDSSGNQGANSPDLSLDVGGNIAILEHGKPNGQVVLPTDGSEGYVLVEKYAYHSLDSSNPLSPNFDPTELPSISEGILSGLVHLAANTKQGQVIQAISDLFSKITGSDSKIPDFLNGYGIHGMAHHEVKVPLSELPPNVLAEIQGNENYDAYEDAYTAKQTADKFPPPGQEAESTTTNGGKVKYYNRGIRTRPDGTKYMEILVLPWVQPKGGGDGYYGSLWSPGSYTTQIEMNYLPDAEPYDADGDLMPSNPDFRGAGNNKKTPPPPPPKPEKDYERNRRRNRPKYESSKLKGKLLSEGVKLGHFEPEALTVDLEKLRKGILPEFPKDPPPKLVNGYSEKSKLLPQKVEGEPFLKVDKKELAKNHRLTDSEIKEFMDEINMINDYIKQNPAELVHAMQRYPKHDVRLAQLNWQMDQKLQASEEYMETHFPENERLFNKLQTKIKQNIDLTDPKNLKGHKEAPTFVQNDITEQQRRKEIVARHFKKKKKKRK